MRLADVPWNDYDVTLDGSGHPQPTERVRFLGGLGIQAQETVAQPPSAVFFHGDLIDSTMMTTDESGSMGFQPVSYTAFGEPVWRDGQGQTHVGWPFPPAGGGSPPAGLGTRYQYAGGWGYESGPWDQDPNDAASPGPLVLYGANPDLPPILLLHVGERWYQPGVGRFVQRDPIGIRAGLNHHLYCLARPVMAVDPSGLVAWYDIVIWLTGGDESWLDDDKTVNTVEVIALGTAGAATLGAACVAGFGLDALIFGGMKVGQLTNPRPLPLRPPAPPPGWPPHCPPVVPPRPHPLRG